MPQQYRVKQGDTLWRIAKDHGFLDWRTIYDDAANADFRKKRSNPHVLFPGDILMLPDRELREESCTTDQRHLFVAHRQAAALRILLKATDDQPLANEPYTLTFQNSHISGTTGPDGLVEQTIPPDIEDVLLTLDGPGIFWSLKVGHLDPVHDDDGQEAIVTGIQARLNNLGFDCGPEDGILGPDTQAALARFQKEVLQRNDPDGVPDGATRDALLQHHGS